MKNGAFLCGKPHSYLKSFENIVFFEKKPGSKEIIGRDKTKNKHYEQTLNLI